MNLPEALRKRSVDAGHSLGEKRTLRSRGQFLKSPLRRWPGCGNIRIAKEMRHRWERCAGSKGGTQGCGVHGVIQKSQLRLPKTASHCCVHHAEQRFSESTRHRCIRIRAAPASCWNAGRKQSSAMSLRNRPRPRPCRRPSGRQYRPSLHCPSCPLGTHCPSPLHWSRPARWDQPPIRRQLTKLRPHRLRLSPAIPRAVDAIARNGPSRNGRRPSLAPCGEWAQRVPSHNLQLRRRRASVRSQFGQRCLTAWHQSQRTEPASAIVRNRKAHALFRPEPPPPQMLFSDDLTWHTNHWVARISTGRRFSLKTSKNPENPSRLGAKCWRTPESA